MGDLLEAISPDLKCWLEAQKVFFVATAPLSGEGRINCSPKGGDSFRVLGEHEVAYLDYQGSGAETAAHLRENGRAVVMFCAFEGKPQIIRLHGRGELLVPGDAGYDALIERFPPHPGARSIVRVEVERLSKSCGWGVPLMRFEDERDGLVGWAEKKGGAGMREYRAEKNARSIDGLPAFEVE